MNFKYKMIAATDIGLVRAANEDCLRILPSLNIAVIADGMGGHKAGDIASRLAVSSVCEYFEEQIILENDTGDQSTLDLTIDAFSLANSQVFANAHHITNHEGMGTTLLTACFQPDNIQIGHIGDSRIYSFSHGELAQLTTDHTLATELESEDSDLELPAYCYHVLRKALGIESGCSPDFFSLAPQKNQIYLMCTDGLSGVIDDHDIATILSLRANQPEYCIETLVNACLENGAPDNISVILVFVSENSA